MSAEFQTIAALIVVAITAFWLVARALAKRKKPGCGNDCGCGSASAKVRLSSRR